MKKLLMLGGSPSQVPAIKKAKEMGYYVITCDYLEDNPGHQFSDEYYNVSTIDKEAVLALAKTLKLDGVVCYAADSGAPTVAYVAEQLGLPAFPYQSVEILSNKDLFRSFLNENNFNVPLAIGYATLEEAIVDFHNFKMPVMVKPIDASGSRGISKINSIELLQEKVEYALSFSRAKRFIIEEYIEKQGYQLGVDGFSVNGHLVFSGIANNHFESKLLNPFLPIGESYPSNLPEHLKYKIDNEIQRLINLLDLKTGPFNVEVQIDNRENIYILDIGVRNSGDLTQIIKYADDIDLIKYTIKAALGEDCSDLTRTEPVGYWSSFLVISEKSGLFKGLEIENEFLKNNIVEIDALVKYSGNMVKPDEQLGKMVLTFSSMAEMLEKMDNMTNWIKIIVEESVFSDVTNT
ncbi:ATP-grasp domain-containing protein [Solibacillus sp. FSL H8-0538]|uniref:ATP-grasp domain-containing protein n=1 Tax=Solibacillus sp. FSL H8-0538 TaxID=2921400 RepID=UPI0030FB8F0B